MIKFEKMYIKQPELNLIADWRNQNLISLRSNDLTVKGSAQERYVNNLKANEKYYFIYNEYEIPTQKDFIGYCGLDKINTVNKTAEMGLLIKSRQQKKGYGAKAIQVLLRMAFEDFNLNCVFIEVIGSTTNWVFWEKQGFKLEGNLRERHYKKGSYYGANIGSILKSEWKNKHLKI